MQRLRKDHTNADLIITILKFLALDWYPIDLQGIRKKTGFESNVLSPQLKRPIALQTKDDYHLNDVAAEVRPIAREILNKMKGMED